MLIEDLYRGKISPYSTITMKNSAARDRLDAAQEVGVPDGHRVHRAVVLSHVHDGDAS